MIVAQVWLLERQVAGGKAGLRLQRCQELNPGFQACTPGVVPLGLGILLRESRGFH